jgi:thiamine-phosphate pyrophosphorylase
MTTPRLYLATPRLPGAQDVESLAGMLTAAIAAADVACLLLRAAPNCADAAIKSAVERLRTATRDRDIAILLEDRVDLVPGAGADGVHLSLAIAYAEARRRLGPDRIVGVTCTTRDEAIDVADGGADYVAFGDFDDPSPRPATLDLTEWWGEVMTVPCVSTGCANARDAGRLAAAGADFVAVDAAAWNELATTVREIAPALGRSPL